MGLTEDLTKIDKDDLHDLVEKEKSFKDKNYTLMDAKSYISKASKNDLLSAIKGRVASDSFSDKKYQKIESIEELETKIYINIKWLKNILFVALVDSSEGTLMLSELFAERPAGVPNNSLCSNIISDTLNDLNLEDERKSFKSSSRKEGVKSAAKYGVGELVKCIVGVFIIIIVAAILRAIF